MTPRKNRYAEARVYIGTGGLALLLALWAGLAVKDAADRAPEAGTTTASTVDQHPAQQTVPNTRTRGS
jgi:hypothetical protein